MKTLEELKSGNLINSTYIKIAAGLETFPQELYTLVDTLEVLDLTDNNLSTLPDDFNRFKKLKRLFLSNNQFSIFINFKSYFINSSFCKSIYFSISNYINSFYNFPKSFTVHIF